MHMPSVSVWRLVTNFVLFQAGWFTCLLIDNAWLYVIFTIILWVHFLWLVPKATVLFEMALLVKMLFVGLCVEVFYLQVGVLVQASGTLIPPVWLLMIWVLFATTLSHSLLWLRKKLYLAAVFSAVAAPLSYYAGVQLNASISFHDNAWLSISIIALSWAVIFPLAFRWVLPHRIISSPPTKTISS
jgi:hypothetical protein